MSITVEDISIDEKITGIHNRILSFRDNLDKFSGDHLLRPDLLTDFKAIRRDYFSLMREVQAKEETKQGKKELKYIMTNVNPDFRDIFGRMRNYVSYKK